jgi:hypothetical protein
MHYSCLKWFYFLEFYGICFDHFDTVTEWPFSLSTNDVYLRYTTERTVKTAVNTNILLQF